MAALEAVRAQFETINTRVLAVNPASVKAHRSYCDRKVFGFPILSDRDREMTGSYDCFKSLGKGVKRTVYALDPEGKVLFAERGQADFGQIIQLIADRQR